MFLANYIVDYVTVLIPLEKKEKENDKVELSF